MRNRFTQQLSFGTLPIEQTPISLKAKDSLTELLAALLEIYTNSEYNEKIFSVLEKYLIADNPQTGRKGMDLWQIFVLSQVRLCKNLSYADLHSYANNHLTLRRLLGVAMKNSEFGGKEFEYQNIYDNISGLNSDMLQEINAIIVEFGHKLVFKKKETEALRLKSDSFVVESNIHFPTDYTLLWDSVRKCIDIIAFQTSKYTNIEGWRKLASWESSLKTLMRQLGKASGGGGKHKAERVKKAAENYLDKTRRFLSKLEGTKFPLNDLKDLDMHIALNFFKDMLIKHIDLVERRILKGEKIPHNEKIFSIFETYSEWINKGKTRPSVELGKKLSITTDQYHLIIDYQIMDHEQDRDILLETADRVLARFSVYSWSLDKGYWNKDSRDILKLYVPQVIMPKLGKKTAAEQQEEKAVEFKKLKNRHSAVESNINELEHRGLDRCPDRGILHYNSYIALGICAYNLKKIGKHILDTQRRKLKSAPNSGKKAA